jgi:putative endonuclease
MFYVYLLVSVADPTQRYVGFTTDLKQRVKAHNEGASVHTSKYKPWQLVTYMAFDEERRAREFEYYLKSGSGRAFANKRLWSPAS